MSVAAGSGGWLAALCASRSLGASWFVAYSAVLPLTQVAWNLSGKEAGLIQAGFHLGYLVSLFIVGFISDHFGAKRAYLTTGVAAWITPFFFALWADGFWSAFWLHALTGLCAGGSYTPALALINDNVPAHRRGRAMGYLIAASSSGYALCLGIAGFALRYTDWRGALFILALLPALSWLLALVVLRQTQNKIHPRPPGEPAHAAIAAIFGNRQGMLSIAAYTFHNWELLGLWAWMPAFLTAALTLHGVEGAAAGALGLSALTFVANIAGSIVGGHMADRWGRTQTILTWSCISLALSFSIGWLIALPVGLLVTLACVHNFASIADSSTHSTLLAESVPAHYLGVAYSIRSAVGFGAGVVSPVVFGWALDVFAGSSAAWGFAWTTLALGGVLGPVATWQLRRVAAR
jgi:MFS family permease